jgi:hypothetical protein
MGLLYYFTKHSDRCAKLYYNKLEILIKPTATARTLYTYKVTFIFSVAAVQEYNNI